MNAPTPGTASHGGASGLDEVDSERPPGSKNDPERRGVTFGTLSHVSV